MKRVSPSATAFGASPGPMKLIEEPRAAPPCRWCESDPPDDPPDDQKPEHRPGRHSEQAEGQRQHVEAERVLHVGNARKPGSPTSSKIFASASIESGVCCAGLMTIVQPAAIAGPILRVPIAAGKFHGVIA